MLVLRSCRLELLRLLWQQLPLLPLQPGTVASSVALPVLSSILQRSVCLMLLFLQSCSSTLRNVLGLSANVQ